MKKIFNLNIEATDSQFAQLAVFCGQYNIEIIDVTSQPKKEEEEILEIKTPFNKQMIGQVADHFDLPLSYIENWLKEKQITCCEEAAEKTGIPGMKEFIEENFLN